MTASSFTSVSLEPPLVLVCIDRRATMAALLTPGTPYLINVLREDQQALAEQFANRADRDRFSGVSYSPSLPDAIAQLDGAVTVFFCRVTQIVDAGDHIVVLSEALAVERRPGRALVWCERGYHCLPAAAVV